MPRRSAAASQLPNILASLRHIAAQVTGDSSDSWMDIDVTMPQMKVLLLLHENGSMRVGMLAQHLKVSTPTITGIMDRLVRQGLAQREDDPTDRRVVRNVLTPQGTQLMERMRHRSDAELERLVDNLPAEEQEAIGRSLRQLADALASGA